MAKKFFRRKGKKTHKKKVCHKPRVLSLKHFAHPPIRNHMDCELKYCDYATLTTGSAGVSISKQFLGNSLYDPDSVFLLGHQPYHLDQIVAMGYVKYAVYASKMEVRASLNSENSVYTGLITIRANSDGSTDNAVDSTILREMDRSVQKQFSISNPAVISKKYTTDGILGLKRGSCLISDSLAAQYNAHPAQGWFWNVTVQDKGRNAAALFDCDIKITYYVRFFAPKQTTQS